jgi:hypothetical protein
MCINGHGITIFNERNQDTFLYMIRNFMIILIFCKIMKKVRKCYSDNINTDLIMLTVKTKRMSLYSVENIKSDTNLFGEKHEAP